MQLRENEGPWHSLPERVNPAVTSYTALNLKPFSTYQFRIRATNDIGPSAFSTESIEVRTLPAAPSKEITNIRAVPITPTKVRVEWDVLPYQYWSGDNDTGGYRVLYQPVTDFPAALQATPKEDVSGINVRNYSFVKILVTYIIVFIELKLFLDNIIEH